MNDLHPELMDSSWVSMMSVFSSFQGKHFDPYKQSAVLKPVAKLLSLLGKKVVVSLIEKGVQSAGVSPQMVRHVKTEKIASMVTEKIKLKKGQKIPFVSIGAPSGAISYLTGMFNGIFLSQHLLFSFKHKRDPDDVRVTYNFGRKLVNEIVNSNDDLLVVNHFDPLHDRFLVKYVNHIRTKFLDLPGPYRVFLENYLGDEAPILIPDVGYSWLQFDMGLKDRGWFQVGGLGGYSDRDFLELPDEVREWLREREGKDVEGWYFEELGEAVERRESEWGFEEQMKESIIEWGKENGHPVYVLETRHPEMISQNFLKASLEREKVSFVLFSAFIAIDPLFARFRKGSAYWLPFICRDSFEALKTWIKENKGLLANVEAVGLSLSPNFTNPPDTVKLEEWIELLREISDVELIGVDPGKYPFDLYSLFSFRSSMRSFSKRLKGSAENKELMIDVEEYIKGLESDELLIKSY